MFTGIVSAVGRIAKATREAGNGKRETGLTLKIQARYKGLKKGESIAVNGACLTIERALPGGFTVHGVSLTINDLPGKDLVQISLIPFTREHTTLGTLGAGDRVHVEGEVLGKYVRQLCSIAR